MNEVRKRLIMNSSIRKTLRKHLKCFLTFILLMLTHFWPMFPFHPLKTPENQRFSGIFRGYKIGTLAKNGLLCFMIIYKKQVKDPYEVKRR